MGFGAGKSGRSLRIEPGGATLARGAGRPSVAESPLVIEAKSGMKAKERWWGGPNTAVSSSFEGVCQSGISIQRFHFSGQDWEESGRM